MARTFGQFVFEIVLDVTRKLACHYVGKLVILSVSRGRWECGPLEASLSEKGFRHLRGRKVYVTTQGVDLVGSITLILAGCVGFLIWYLREADRVVAHVFAWAAVVVLSFALFRIWRNAIRLAKENTAAETDATTFTLTMNDGESSVPNPTESDVRKALASLRKDEEPYDLILRKGSCGIQVTCRAKDSFTVQMQEGEEQRLYQTTHDLSSEASAKLLLAFRNGDPDWKKRADWKR